jgi:hypothetical protein
MWSHILRRRLIRAIHGRAGSFVLQFLACFSKLTSTIQTRSLSLLRDHGIRIIITSANGVRSVHYPITSFLDY